MRDLLELVSFAWRRAREALLSASVLASLGCVASTFVAVAAWEAATGREMRRYLTRNARTDAIYTLFYVAGVFSFLVSGPINRALRLLVSDVAPLDANLARALPAAAQVALAFLVMDAVGYWMHRLMHASPLLWAFHRIHHSQQRLTVLTNFRFHFVEVALFGLATFVPGLLLKAPAWLAASLVALGVQLLAHSGHDWSYGPLDRLLVSPRFHGVHHSTDPRHYGSNFGMLFSLWDRLFGTALTGERATAFGSPGFDAPESFTRQALHPFLALLRGRAS